MAKEADLAMILRNQLNGKNKLVYRAMNLNFGMSTNGNACL